MAERRAPGDVAQLVADHAPVLYRYAYRLSGSVADAEDLTQEVFLVAQRKLDQVRDSQNVRAWLFTVLRNCYLKSRRQRLPRPIGGDEFDIDTVPDEVCQQSIDSEELQQAIAALAEEFKVVVLMFYFEHRSYREIAELLDIPPGTVMSRLARAKAHLRRWLVEPASKTIRIAEKTANGSIAAYGKPAAIGH
jgi:RNA polymerase sigma-70 factor (ECF subfamily)